MKKIIGIVYGTRPEFLKLLPVIKEFTKQKVDLLIINTGQHEKILTELEEYFHIKPTYNFELQNKGYTNYTLVAKLVELLGHTIETNKLAHIIAQGDTFTVLAASIASFLLGAKFYHVEAGLRTNNIHTPFPEEYNRRIISLSTTIHYAPTQLAYANLIEEKHPSTAIAITGNTSVDLIHYILKKEKIKITYQNEVFITAHRRENLGQPLQNIALAIKKLATKYPLLQFNWSLHPNPAIKILLSKHAPYPKNIAFLAPLIYPEALKLMAKALVVISDSGGIQEEVPSLKKKILILRQETERPEVVSSGFGILVGTNTRKIVDEFDKLYCNQLYKDVTTTNPFGDGKAAKRIYKSIQKNLA